MCSILQGANSVQHMTGIAEDIVRKSFKAQEHTMHNTQQLLFILTHYSTSDIYDYVL